jgi:hypothetical protein
MGHESRPIYLHLAQPSPSKLAQLAYHWLEVDSLLQEAKALPSACIFLGELISTMITVLMSREVASVLLVQLYGCVFVVWSQCTMC